MSVKFPQINVKLLGKDSNAFSILGAVSRELRNAGVTKEEQDAFMDEAMSGDYNHLLVTVQKWVRVH